jgi:hypothetical protein
MLLQECNCCLNFGFVCVFFFLLYAQLFIGLLSHMCCTVILSQQDGAPFCLHVYTSIPLLFCLYINFFPHKMVILLRFMNTHGHHAAARKENQLQTVRGALGLDAEDVQKKGGL